VASCSSLHRLAVKVHCSLERISSIFDPDQDPGSTFARWRADIQTRGQRLHQRHRWFGYFWQAWINYQRHWGATVSAGLAYHTLFSIFPILILLSLLGSYFLQARDIRISLYLALRQLVPGSALLVDEIVLDLVNPMGTVGIIGLAGLAWAATGVFKVLSGALDRAFGVHTSIRNIITGFVILILVGLLFILAASLSATVGIFSVLDSAIRPGRSPSPEVNFLIHLLSWMLATLAFLLIYRFVPSCKVSWQAAITVALPVGAIWKLAQHLFSLVTSRFVDLSPVYGSLATVVALLLWLFITSSIFLLGAELVAVLNDPDGRNPCP
jgi:membrane protein